MRQQQLDAAVELRGQGRAATAVAPCHLPGAGEQVLPFVARAAARLRSRRVRRTLARHRQDGRLVAYLQDAVAGRLPSGCLRSRSVASRSSYRIAGSMLDRQRRRHRERTPGAGSPDAYRGSNPATTFTHGSRAKVVTMRLNARSSPMTPIRSGVVVIDPASIHCPRRVRRTP